MAHPYFSVHFHCASTCCKLILKEVQGCHKLCPISSDVFDVASPMGNV